MLNKMSSYWKCQLIGWFAFLIVATIFNNLVYHETINEFLPFAISIYFFGLLFSHLMKITINKLGILQKKFATQVINLSILTILYSFIGTFIWIMIMTYLGFWKIKGTTWDVQLSEFKEHYFYNLYLVLLTFFGWTLIYFLFHYVKGVRREEQLKTAYQLQMTEMEAKALRAQMNPHFIFNCLNSIKSLIQEDQKDKSVAYLNTFSKLIRTLFNNADKREISLYDEIETCKLYLELEAMRFDAKFSYDINIDNTIDLKSVKVPALIIQPFIENAIWHGIVPHNTEGNISLHVVRNNRSIEIVIDDDGIGREASQQNRSASSISHQSKGVNLTQSRLELNNLLQQRKAELEIIDKKDAKGIATGTTVIIKIREELS